MTTRLQNCCNTLHDSFNRESPFSRIFSLGYYDGTTAGVAQCAVCSTEYRYEMLDWDDDQDVRIYGFAPLPSGSMQRLIAIGTTLEEPRWPLWSPIWRFPTDDMREGAHREVEMILNTAGRLEFVLASLSLAKEIISARRLPQGEKDTLDEWLRNKDTTDQRDWFAFLGLKKGWPN